MWLWNGYQILLRYFQKVSEIRSGYTIIQVVKKLLVMQETPSCISSSNWLTLVFSNWLIGKEPDAGKDWRREEKGMAEDEIVGWHHQLNGHEFNSWVRKICWRRDRLPTPVFLGFPCDSTGKESACSVGDLGSIPGLERSPREGKGYPLQYAGLENSMDCLSPWSHRVEQDWAAFTFTYCFIKI